MRVLLTLCAVVNLAATCRIPPEFWCDTPEIAVECQVYDSCAKFVWSDVSAAPPVKISLYYESLCPGCKAFIQEQLKKAVQSVGDIMDVELVPYGNAHESHDGSKWVFQCQHGPSECVGNVIETCAMEAKNFTAYWPFILCLESAQGTDFSVIAPKCAQQVGIPYDSISACANGSHGNDLEHEMAKKTDSLSPPHQYTPWINVNGKHTEIMQRKAQMNLVKLVCDTYQGPKPEACKQYVQAASLRSFASNYVN